MRPQMYPVAIYSLLALGCPHVDLLFQHGNFFIIRVILHGFVMARDRRHLTTGRKLNILKQNKALSAVAYRH